MGFRFQKRIRIFKGLTLNLSKSGTSWTVGGSLGGSVNVRGDKVTCTLGAPGTGLSNVQRLMMRIRPIYLVNQCSVEVDRPAVFLYPRCASRSGFDWNSLSACVG